MAIIPSSKVVIREAKSSLCEGNFVVELHHEGLCFRLVRAKGLSSVNRQRALGHAARTGKKVADLFEVPLFIVDGDDKKERRLVFKG
jgi:hypothetical protein